MADLTKRQREIVKLYEAIGNKQRVADSLGVKRGTVRTALKRAADKGWTPALDATKAVPHNHIVAKTSVLVDADGNVKQQWIKTDREADAIAAAAEQLNDVLANWKPPKFEYRYNFGETEDDLLTLYTLTDYHLGMKAWPDETGDDWNCEIAAKMFGESMAKMCDASHKSTIGVLNIQGDFLHWDGLDAVTPTHRNVLDADTRFPMLAELALTIITEAALMMTSFHHEVRIYICEGNHDLASSVWMQTAIKMFFADHPNVHVDDTKFPYYAFQWGDNMIAMHHGHKKKMTDLPALFSSEPRYRKMWGDAKQTYIHCGHYHHQEMKESGGAIIERHPTLAGADAHSARGGYVSRRAAHAITYHKTKGEVSRVTVVP